MSVISAHPVEGLLANCRRVTLVPTVAITGFELPRILQRLSDQIIPMGAAGMG